MVSRDTPDLPTYPGWEVRSNGPHGIELRWRRDPAEALALAFTLDGTISPASAELCADCEQPILPDQPAGYDFARGRCHAWCFIEVTR